jgi:hypothetical protein
LSALSLPALYGVLRRAVRLRSTMTQRDPAPRRTRTTRTTSTSSRSRIVTGIQPERQSGRQGVLPVRIPALPPLPELRRHRPGRQPPASLEPGEPDFSRRPSRDVTPSLPVPTPCRSRRPTTPGRAAARRCVLRSPLGVRAVADHHGALCQSGRARVRLRRVDDGGEHSDGAGAAETDEARSEPRTR